MQNFMIDFRVLVLEDWIVNIIKGAVNIPILISLINLQLNLSVWLSLSAFVPSFHQIEWINMWSLLKAHSIGQRLYNNSLGREPEIL